MNLNQIIKEAAAEAVDLAGQIRLQNPGTAANEAIRRLQVRGHFFRANSSPTPRPSRFCGPPDMWRWGP